MNDDSRPVLAPLLALAVIAAWGWAKVSGDRDQVQAFVFLAGGALGLWLWKPWDKRRHK